MNKEIIFICIFLQYKTCFCSLNADIDEAHRFYTLTAGQQDTDEQTLFYIENRYTKKGTKIVDNGFTFDSRRPLKCRHKTRTVHFPTLAKSTRSKFWIFACPPLLYTDLETGEQKTSPYLYKISNGRTYDSAILFVQKDSESKDMYPQKYVQNIDFIQLRSYKIQLPVESDLSKTTNDEIIRTYLQEKNAAAPYSKFQQFFSSINVCSLRRAHKIYLCKQGMRISLKFPYFQFDFLNYDETLSSCRKYRLPQSKLKNGITNNPLIKNELHMIRCPPLNPQYLLNIYSPKSMHLYYVTSSLLNRSITLFRRQNDKEVTPTLEFTITGLKIELIFEYNRRERFWPEPSKIVSTKKTGYQKSYQEIEDEINSSSGEVRPLLALKRSKRLNSKTDNSQAPGILQFMQDRWLSDHVLIAFSKVKKTKLIYRKFVMTHKSIDVCQLTSRQKTILCNAALVDLMLPGVDELFVANEFNDCSMKKVTLTRLEADDFETNQFSMCPCLSYHRHENSYFLGKNHLKDSATIYSRAAFGKVEYYYPHTLITKIDRNKLVRKDELPLPTTPFI